MKSSDHFVSVKPCRAQTVSEMLGMEPSRASEPTVKKPATLEQFDDALKERTARILGLKVGTVKPALRKVTSELTASIYGTPGGTRRFAERVRDGALGRYLSWVYFIGQGDAGPVKIGVANDPRKRLATLQTGSHEPLALLGMVHGDETVEKTLHGAFSPDRIRGEWFTRSAPIVEFLRVLNLREKRAEKNL